MNRMLYVIVVMAIIVAGGMYLILRFQAPRGIKIPDAVPVTGIPTLPAVQPETPKVIRKESTGSGVLGAETARFSAPDDSISFRYPVEWVMTKADPGEGTGPYGRILYRFRFAPENTAGPSVVPVNLELEISEIAGSQTVEPLKACLGMERECGIMKAGGQEFVRIIRNSGQGRVAAEYKTYTDSRYYRLNATIPQGNDADAYIENLDALVSSATVR